MERTWHDVRYGARMLRKRPGFTAIAVLSLAIGIGANTAIFSLVNAIILQDNPFNRPEELVIVYGTSPSDPFKAMSYPDFEELRDGTTTVFSGIGVAGYVIAPVDREGSVGAIMGQAVTGDYLPLLGVEASLGRAIGPSDDVAPGGHPVVMLSHGYWQRAFGGDRDVVGRELRLGARAYTIIGVAPATYRGSVRGLAPEFYIPMTMFDELMGYNMREARGTHSLGGMARLAPGVTLAQARTAVTAVATSLDEARLEGWDVGDGFALVPSTEVLVTPQVDTYIRAVAWLLMMVVGLVLILACTNLASFLLARARDRRREVAVRLALGASRGALVRQLLTETTLLGLLGGVAGLGLAVGLLRLLQNADFPLPFNFKVTLELAPDATVLAFTCGLSVLAGGLLGLVPALQSTRSDVVTALKQDTAGGGQPGQLRWRNALIVTQLTLSLVLLVGAGLFLRSFQQLNAIDPGFGRQPTALMLVTIPNTRFTADEGREYARRLLERFRALPGADAVGLIDDLPLDISNSRIDFNVDGHEPPQGRDAHRAERASVDSSFFDAAGIPILRGRRFRDADGPEAPRVAIISEEMARRFWPDGDALGRIVRRAGQEEDVLRVVGVAADTKVSSLSESPVLMVYLPYTQQEAILGFYFVARTSIDPDQMGRAMVSAGREIDPELWAALTSTMARHLAIPRLPAQLGAFVVSAFAFVALGLAVIGLYGVVSYAVASRTREVGIRMALGANAPAIIRLLAGDGLRLVLIGCGIGLTLSLLVTQLLSSLLFGVQPFDPITFVGAPLVLCATAVLAAYLPARRASRVDLVAALRAD